MATNAISISTQTDAFADWWDREGEWVEPPNIRRGGESGVKRVVDDRLGLLYLKRQVGHTYWNLWHPFGRPTAMRERDALLAFPKIGVGVPEIVYGGARRVGGKWHAVIVTRDLEDHEDMTHWYAQGGRDRVGERHADLLKKIGGTLGRIHRHHWQHSCLYPKHIFLSARPGADGLPGVALIDLEKCRRVFSANWGARHDLDQLRRHAPMWNDSDWAVLLAGHAAAFGRRVT